MRMKVRYLIGAGLVLLFLVGAFFLAQMISRTQAYDVKGRVAGFRGDGRTLFVEHEKVPGYMPAMTMPLPVRDSSMIASLETGDAIQFRLAVSRDSAWITALKPLPDSAVARHPSVKSQSRQFTSAAGAQMLQRGDRLPADVTLTNQAGEQFQLGDFRGQVLVLTFIYTRCPLPNYCPLMSKNFAALQPKLRQQFGTEVKLLSISFDPEYDTPEVLRDYAGRYTDRLDTWTFATGSTAQIDRVTRLFGVFTKKEGGQITHNLTTAVIGPEGKVVRLWRGNDWTPEYVLQAVDKTFRDAPR